MADNDDTQPVPMSPQEAEASLLEDEVAPEPPKNTNTQNANIMGGDEATILEETPQPGPHATPPEAVGVYGISKPTGCEHGPKRFAQTAIKDRDCKNLVDMLNLLPRESFGGNGLEFGVVEDPHITNSLYIEPQLMTRSTEESDLPLSSALPYPTPTLPVPTLPYPRSATASSCSALRQPTTEMSLSICSNLLGTSTWAHWSNASNLVQSASAFATNLMLWRILLVLHLCAPLAAMTVAGINQLTNHQNLFELYVKHRMRYMHDPEVQSWWPRATCPRGGCN